MLSRVNMSYKSVPFNLSQNLQQKTLKDMKYLLDSSEPYLYPVSCERILRYRGAYNVLLVDGGWDLEVDINAMVSVKI